jgi:hypothetical protein
MLFVSPLPEEPLVGRRPTVTMCSLRLPELFEQSRGNTDNASDANDLELVLRIAR